MMATSGLRDWIISSAETPSEHCPTTLNSGLDFGLGQAYPPAGMRSAKNEDGRISEPADRKTSAPSRPCAFLATRPLIPTKFSLDDSGHRCEPSSGEI